MEFIKLTSCDMEVMLDAPRRVLVVNVPDMLSELLASVSSDAGVELQVLNSIRESDMLTAIRRFQPHIVIAHASHAVALSCAQPVKVYLVDPEALSTLRIELRPICEDLGNVPLSQVITSVKANNEH